MKNIIIIGAGWYGLHIYLYIKENFTNFNIIILEKKNDIFENSSNYNQNRLHLGYHYPRSETTRILCKNGYDKFIKKYREVVDFIDNNFYMISNNSIIDYGTYLKIYNDDANYDHSILINNFLRNIDGNIINTKEKIINSNKTKEYFKKHVNTDDIKLNYLVKKIEEKDNKIIINDDLTCDILLDCTYNQLNLSNNYIFELTISLLYEKINDTIFDSLTLMDGDFFSLFPRDITKEKYTLTHVKYTPLIKSENVQDIFNYELTEEKILDVKKNMENNVKIYYKEFLSNFKYVDYFTSYKCKSISKNDSRECNIQKNKNVISVNCGKITGIFEFESFIKNILEEYNNG
jgi:hypothetical protein